MLWTNQVICTNLRVQPILFVDWPSLQWLCLCVFSDVPYSQRSQALFPLWEDLAKALKHREDVIIARFDASANDINMSMQGPYPTLYLFPALCSERVSNDKNTDRFIVVVCQSHWRMCSVRWCYTPGRGSWRTCLYFWMKRWRKPKNTELWWVILLTVAPLWALNFIVFAFFFFFF